MPDELRRGERATWGPQPFTDAEGSAQQRMTLRGWKSIRKGSRVGLASISLPIGLQIDDVPVFATKGKIWANLPARPVITSDGTIAKVPGTGKTQYASFLRWRDRALNEAFSRAVVELVQRMDPEAFVADSGDDK